MAKKTNYSEGTEEIIDDMIDLHMDTEASIKNTVNDFKKLRKII